MKMIDEKDGREYKVVEIGNRVWMAENYAFLGDDDEYWGMLSPRDKSHVSSYSPFVYVYEYDGSDIEEAKKLEHYKTYGAFYNYEAAVSLAPKGWHLPTLEDWVDLQQSIGMSKEEIDAYGGYLDRGNVAGKLKEPGTWTHRWGTVPANCEEGANNLSGFSALATGEGIIYDSYPEVPGWSMVGGVCNYWSTQQDPSDDCKVCKYKLIGYCDFISRCFESKNLAFSVRYVKDKENEE
ncbi:hypothetical protein MHBO_004093 [Bonamia ostreae]|uniref:Fibrobacter succinogenes major paralogous domain-containing protein n=1 Tax=Bonamia ostreae TaxID=126728 RepID=A0ABV2ASC4_9EUKA